MQLSFAVDDGFPGFPVEILECVAWLSLLLVELGALGLTGRSIADDSRTAGCCEEAAGGWAETFEAVDEGRATCVEAVLLVVAFSILRAFNGTSTAVSKLELR